MAVLFAGVIGLGVGAATVRSIFAERRRIVGDLDSFKYTKDAYDKIRVESKSAFDPNSRQHQVYIRKSDIEIQLLDDKINYLSEWLNSGALYQLLHPQSYFGKALGEIEASARQQSGYDSY